MAKRWAVDQWLKETYGIAVTRDAVSTAQRTLNPPAVVYRRKKRLVRREYEVAGPNALCHFDQNDKFAAI